MDWWKEVTFFFFFLARDMEPNGEVVAAQSQGRDSISWCDFCLASLVPYRAHSSRQHPVEGELLEQRRALGSGPTSALWHSDLYHHHREFQAHSLVLGVRVGTPCLAISIACRAFKTFSMPLPSPQMDRI